MQPFTKILICCALGFIAPLVALAEGDAVKGKEKYDQLCAQCHGPKGAGDGPVGVSLPEAMKPADLSLGQYKYATDAAKFEELLLKGGAAVGLNPLMPPQAGLNKDDIANLYAYIQSMKK